MLRRSSAALDRAGSSYIALSKFFSSKAAQRPVIRSSSQPLIFARQPLYQDPRLTGTFARLRSERVRFYSNSNSNVKESTPPLTPPPKESVPSVIRRPTKAELLAVTSGFLQRLKIHFKWITIRGFRPYRVDDWSGMVSWFLGGMGIWIAVGTTSFMAFVFLLLNSLQMQEWIAAKLGKYLTESSGTTVVFESAIVPRFSWGDSKITFKNVSISRGHNPPAIKQPEPQPSHVSEAEADQVVVYSPLEDTEVESTLTRFKRRASTLVKESQHALLPSTEQDAFQEEKMRWTKFAITIDTIDVTLSVSQWLDGKGIVKDAVVKGVRGEVDRRHVKHDPTAPIDRMAYRHVAKPGDFHLEGLIVEDFLVTIYQPDNFRPYTCSIFSANLPLLRKQWLFLDLMSAESMTGQIDNCLFSLHRPQSIELSNSQDTNDGQPRFSRFRIDGVNIDHLKSPHDTGALSWITAGKVDLVVDIAFPRRKHKDSFESILGDIADQFDQVVFAKSATTRLPGQKELAGGMQPLEPPSSTRQRLGLPPDASTELHKGTEPFVLMDLSLRFKDIKATIPLFTPDLSYVNNALIRPIVAFLNANRTLIPIKCRVQLDLSAFDGSWTTYDTGILDAISAQVYEALAYYVRSENDRRAKQVGMWSLQLTARGVLSAIKAYTDKNYASATQYDA